MAQAGSLARRYARALLTIAADKKRIKEIGDELLVISSFFDQYPDLFVQLLSPALDIGNRDKFISTMIQSLALSEDMSNFMHLLNHKGRLEHIKKIQEQYRLLADQASGLVRAQVFSARPLAPDMQTRLILALEKRTLKKVQAEFAVSPELIGGLKVQIGGMLLDGSVAEQLRRMEESLKRI